MLGDKNMSKESGFCLSEVGIPLVNGQHNPGDNFLNIDSCNPEVKLLSKGDVIELSLYDDKPAPAGMLYNIKGKIRHEVFEDIYTNDRGQAKIMVPLDHEIWDNTVIKRVWNVKQD